MRTDCKIDSKPIKCPNAQRTGYNLGVANIGNLIVYREYHQDDSYSMRVARVLGRVTAPKVRPDDREVKGFALVMALSDDCTHAYERWVDPQWIDQVREVPTAMLEFFARPTLPPVDLLRRKMESGYVTVNYLAQSGLDDINTTKQDGDA